MRIQKSNLIPAGLRIGLASLVLIGAAAQSFAAGTSTLNATDAAGTSSFNSALHWTGGFAPGPGTNFFTSTFTLRTPSAAGNYTFLGDSLTINSGATLEFTTDLTPPVVWSELDAPSVPTNGMMGVNLSITNNSQFYRLKLP